MTAAAKATAAESMILAWADLESQLRRYIARGCSCEERLRALQLIELLDDNIRSGERLLAKIARRDRTYPPLPLPKPLRITEFTEVRVEQGDNR